MDRPQILLVDDVPEVIEYCCRILTPDRFEIIGTASNGRLALDICSETTPDVIVMDISMPELNGIEVAKRLRSAGCRAAIVFLSADSDSVLDAMDAGGSAFIAKPLLSGDLLAGIREALAGRVFVSVPPRRVETH